MKADLGWNLRANLAPVATPIISTTVTIAPQHGQNLWQWLIRPYNEMGTRAHAARHIRYPHDLHHHPWPLCMDCSALESSWSRRTAVGLDFEAVVVGEASIYLAVEEDELVRTDIAEGLMDDPWFTVPRVGEQKRF